MNSTTGIQDETRDSTGRMFSVESLMSYLQRVPDPRKARGVRYRLVELLVLLILAKLGGEDGLKGMAEWVRIRGEALIPMLGLSRSSLPHQTTYERVLERLDVGVLEQIIGDFFAHQPREGDITVRIDGKVLRGTIPAGSTQGVHLLAGYVPEQGVVLMQVEVGEKGNERSHAPRLLQALDLRGCVVTGDAMFTDPDLCEQIVAAHGDYVFPVKRNLPTLQRAIADAFMPPPTSPGHSALPLPSASAQSIHLGRGRIEYRDVTVTSALNHYLDWPQLAQVFRLQRLVQHKRTGKLTYQVVFGVTSLSPERCSPQRLLGLIRDHWHIENRLHWVRDVTFHEDASPIRSTPCQRVLACLNNLVIGLIRQTPFAYVPEARRFFAFHPDRALALLLS